jgi:2,3-bisphosphoglycerate-independent phosphoglycerate mutase
VKGIGIIMGMDPIDVPGATGYIDTNYEGKASYALRALKKNDFVFLHVEATDEMGHNGDINGKIQAIEKFDSLIVKPIMEGMKKFGEYKVMVTSDHATPVKTKTHTGEPVPFMIFNSTKSIENGLPGFTEKDISGKNEIFFDKGWELFPYFIGEA